MTVFVTGSTGFIGQNLLGNKRFNNLFKTVYGFRDISIKPPDISAVKLDLNNHRELIDTIDELKPKSAILAGWQGLPDYSPEMCILNHYNQLTLIQQLIKNNCTKILLTGSCWQYGNLTGELKENMSTGATGIFADTKNSIFQFANKMAQGSECTIIDARIFFVYGNGQRASSIIPSTINSLRTTGTCQIRTPNASNDFIHIDDVIEAFIKILQFNFDKSTVVNIGSGQARPVKEVVNIICKSIGINKQFDSNYVSSGFWANNELLKSLGWKAGITLEDGIKDFISKN
ncbi:MAG: NAD(P)-dependent oxidoreductase [Bacteriovorax sp.]|nr:NAD(P)-dependent oxidoreductase [Bacteriovorax sp.]